MALEPFIAERKTAGYAPNTIVGRVSAISAFYRWCVREQLVVRNPVELIAHADQLGLTPWLADAGVPIAVGAREAQALRTGAGRVRLR